MTDLVDDGRHATSRSQCPYKPSDPQWREWQQQYLNRQRRDPERVAAAEKAAVERAAAAGITLNPISGRMTWTNQPAPVSDVAQRAAAALAEADAYDRAERLRELMIALASVTVSPLAIDAFRQFADELANLPDQPDPDVRTIRGRPAGRTRHCHHGNPAGNCRQCSGVGRH